MSTTEKSNPIKILVYSSDIVVDRIAPLLEGADTEVITISAKLTSSNLEFLLTHSGDIALAILDITEQYTGCLCRFLGQINGIPVVLLVDSNKTNWEVLGNCAASAYIPLSAGDTELAMRLKAITRRITALKQKEQNQLLFSERV
jgi:hypothetical protein